MNATDHRIAPIIRAVIRVIAASRVMSTARIRIAVVLCANVAVVAVQRSAGAMSLSAHAVRKAYGAAHILIVWHMDAANRRITGIIGADVVVVTTDRFMPNAF